MYDRSVEKFYPEAHPLFVMAMNRGMKKGKEKRMRPGDLPNRKLGMR